MVDSTMIKHIYIELIIVMGPGVAFSYHSFVLLSSDIYFMAVALIISWSLSYKYPYVILPYS